MCTGERIEARSEFLFCCACEMFIGHSATYHQVFGPMLRKRQKKQEIQSRVATPVVQYNDIDDKILIGCTLVVFLVFIVLMGHGAF